MKETFKNPSERGEDGYPCCVCRNGLHAPWRAKAKIWEKIKRRLVPIDRYVGTVYANKHFYTTCCIKCAERILGRPITAQDLDNTACNSMFYADLFQ